MSDKDPITLNCPTCRKIVAWTDEFPYRPFCSKRCQQIDFGDWAMEKNAIPVEDGPDFEDME